MPPLGISVLGLLLFICGYFSIVEAQDLSNFISGVPEGVPGVDYPDYASVPRRSAFNCRDRKPGFYADPDTRCQVWHWCDTFLIKHSFLCPNLTVFSQKIRGCDWWYNVDCNLATSLYVNNDELYRVTPEEEAREAARKQKELNDRLDRQRGIFGHGSRFKPVQAITESNLNDAENDLAFSSTVQSDLSFSVTTWPPPPPPTTQPPPPTTTTELPPPPPTTTTEPPPPPSTTTTEPPPPPTLPPTTTPGHVFPVASSTLAPIVLQPRPVIPQGPNSFFFRPIANAISITGLFPTTPRTPRPTTSITTPQPIVTEFQPPANFQPVAPIRHEFAPHVPNAGPVAGAPVSHSAGIITAGPAPLAVNFRRRPSRLRPQTFVPLTGPSTTLPPSTTVEAFDLNPSTVSVNTIVLNENRLTDPQFIEDTTRAFGTTLDVESLRLVPSSHSQGTNGDFVEPETATTSSLTLNTFHTEAPSISAVNQFPAFTGTTPQRVASFRPSFQPFPTTTPSVSRIPPSTVTSTFVPRPTEAFNFGVPFGSRISGEASNNIIASALVPHETNEVTSSSTAQDVFESTTETLRHRKFISNGNTRIVQTFPPFPVTTFSPKTTTFHPTEEFSTTTTSIPTTTTTAFIFNRRRGANKNETLLTTTAIELDTEATTFASTKLTKLPIITAKHRTFPSFPITTFRPSTTPAEFEADFGQRDSNDVSDKNSDLSPLPTLSQNDDVSLSR